MKKEKEQEHLNPALPLALDTETELIGAGRLAPRCACVTVAQQRQRAAIYTPRDMVPLLKRWIVESDQWLIGHNIAYDLLVLTRYAPDLCSYVWYLYDTGRVWDLGIHERLYCLGMGWSMHPAIGKPIVTGGVSLADLARGLVSVEYGSLKISSTRPSINGTRRVYAML